MAQTTKKTKRGQDSGIIGHRNQRDGAGADRQQDAWNEPIAFAHENPPILGASLLVRLLRIRQPRRRRLPNEGLP